MSINQSGRRGLELELLKKLLHNAGVLLCTIFVPQLSEMTVSTLYNESVIDWS